MARSNLGTKLILIGSHGFNICEILLTFFLAQSFCLIRSFKSLMDILEFFTDVRHHSKMKVWVRLIPMSNHTF
ncbi:hypothetical protein CF645_34570 [Burkholderia pseudomallei]|nr:hypothetical protein CF640_32530 [Burkholderia pseudomallei]PNX15646.1 hypothetical protein CF645_34570 [Burkholderia pseudomallei]